MTVLYKNKSKPTHTSAIKVVILIGLIKATII